jgi:hypothetical protein
LRAVAPRPVSLGRRRITGQNLFRQVLDAHLATMRGESQSTMSEVSPEILQTRSGRAAHIAIVEARSRNGQRARRCAPHRRPTRSPGSCCATPKGRPARPLGPAYEGALELRERIGDRPGAAATPASA